jgi:hypothetical protein
MAPEELRLPPGYRLNSGVPDLWTLRRPSGRVVASFRGQRVTKEALCPSANFPVGPIVEIELVGVYLL